MFCCTLFYVHSSIAIILMGKRELIALLNLPSWCLVMVERLFLAVPRGCLQFVIVVFPDHTHLLFFFVNKFDAFYLRHNPDVGLVNKMHYITVFGKTSTILVGSKLNRSAMVRTKQVFGMFEAES